MHSDTLTSNVKFSFLGIISPDVFVCYLSACALVPCTVSLIWSNKKMDEDLRHIRREASLSWTCIYFVFFLPTIMISSIHCLSTMMKCIALGAVEFLRKPMSEDKLRNIWQHVVHNA